MKLSHAAICSLLCALVAGCGSRAYRAENQYEGSQSFSDISTLRLSQCLDASGDETGKTGFVGVDGKDLTDYGHRITGMFIDEVSVLPGKHRVQIWHRVLDFARNRKRTSWANLWIIARPGHTYIASCTGDNMSFSVHFEDAETHQIVGGIVGSDDEPSTQPDSTNHDPTKPAGATLSISPASSPVPKGAANNIRSRAEIDAVIDNRKRALQQAASSAVGGRPVTGQIVFDFVVTPDGKVQNLTISSTSFAEPKCAAAVQAQLATIAFQTKNVEPYFATNYVISLP